MEEIIVTYMAFGLIHEESFEINITLKDIHIYLNNLCNTYAITDINIKTKTK
jgi:hypothetical protein